MRSVKVNLSGIGQPGGTERQALGAETAGLATALLDEGHGGEAAGVVEVLIDIEGVVGLVEGAIARPVAQAALGLRP